MATVHKSCARCEHWRNGLRRCINGKVNPPTRKGTVDAMRFGGYSAVCGYNQWKDSIDFQVEVVNHRIF